MQLLVSYHGHDASIYQINNKSLCHLHNKFGIYENPVSLGKCLYPSHAAECGQMYA